MQILTALLSGLLFGIGLLVSGMADPAKVIGFLDISGRWNPSLLFVMGGAILISAPAFRIAASRSRSLLGAPLPGPAAGRIDRRLLLGSLAFGAGWGMAGFCPGPALTSLLAGSGKPALFVLAMLAGMGLYELIERRRRPRLPDAKLQR